MLNYLAAWTLNADYHPRRLPGSSHPTLYPSQVFATADGHIAIMCAKEKFWQALVVELEDDAFAADPRFATFADRLIHREDLALELERRFLARTSSDWLMRFRGKVPSAPVNTVEEALQDEQILARNMVVQLDHPSMGPIRVTGNPIKMNGETSNDYQPAPGLGADSERILIDMLGYSTEKVAELRSHGVI